MRFIGAGTKRAEETKVAELERNVAQQAMEDRFFKTSLAARRGAAPAAGAKQRRAFYEQEKRSEDRNPVEREPHV